MNTKKLFDKIQDAGCYDNLETPEGESMDFSPMPGSLVVNQELIDAIYERAKKINFGIGEPEQTLDLSQYGKPHNAESLAMCLINGFHGKYDIISILQATIEILSAHLLSVELANTLQRTVEI